MRRSLVIGLIVMVLALTGWFRFTQFQRWNEITGETMGSTYRLQFGIPKDGPSQLTLAAITNELRKTIKQADDRLSTWKTNSELSRFNSQRTTDWFPVDASTVAIVAIAVEMHAIDSRFDITAAPLSDLWGLGPGGRGMDEPSQLDIEQCLMHVGTDQLEFRLEPPALRKLDPLLQIDLSSLAAGFVADRVAEQLRRLGTRDFFIDVAGEIVVSGRNRSGAKWRVGIAEPKVGSAAIRTKMELTDSAIATSGNYRKFIEINGQSFGHILDPSTGRPAVTDILSATVVNPSGTRADAIATLLMTMPASDALALANEQGWYVLLITAEGELQSVNKTPTLCQVLNSGP